MKAITLWQPWASMLACGAKQFETRSWATNYQGPIAIHAAAISIPRILKQMFPLGEWSYAPDYVAKQSFLNAVGKALEDYVSIEDVVGYLSELPRGMIIATAELVGCWEIAKDPEGPFVCRPHFADRHPDIDRVMRGNEILFGDWTPGRYAWEFANMTMLPQPIPATGRQGLWNWDARVNA